MKLTAHVINQMTTQVVESPVNGVKHHQMDSYEQTLLHFCLSEEIRLNVYFYIICVSGRLEIIFSASLEIRLSQT